MINIDKTKVTVKGDGFLLMAELATAISVIYDMFVDDGLSKEDAKEYIQDAVDLGFMSLEEVKDKALDKLKELTIEELIDVVDALKDEEEGEKEND